jgi:DNA cross-link repair 1A protein
VTHYDHWAPPQKRIPSTDWIVDGFPFRLVPPPAPQIYFLTHFHSDHYGGLSKSFAHGIIYGSRPTLALVALSLNVCSDALRPLPFQEPIELPGGHRVVLLDANHCPGACLFLFLLADGRRVLHTGDFRADPSRVHYPLLVEKPIDVCYLDTTYCGPAHVFPAQDAVLRKVSEVVSAEIVKEKKEGKEKLLFLVGAYSIGKERMAVAVADACQCNHIIVPQRKYGMLQCLELPYMHRFCTHPLNSDKNNRNHQSNATASIEVHMIPMFGLKFQHMEQYAAQLEARQQMSYDRIYAFEPTGWTFTRSSKKDSGSLLRRSDKGRLSLFRVPYSEHSSFQELRDFVAFLRPRCIVPTVNVTTCKRVRTMLGHFQDLVPVPANSDDHVLLAQLQRREKRMKAQGGKAGVKSAEEEGKSGGLAGAAKSAASGGIQRFFAILKGGDKKQQPSTATTVVVDDDENENEEEDEEDDEREEEEVEEEEEGVVEILEEIRDMDDLFSDQVVSPSKKDDIFNRKLAVAPPLPPASHINSVRSHKQTAHVVLEEEIEFDIACVDLEEQIRIMQQFEARASAFSSVTSAVSTTTTFSTINSSTTSSVTNRVLTDNPRKRQQSNATSPPPSSSSSAQNALHPLSPPTKQAKLSDFFFRKPAL